MTSISRLRNDYQGRIIQLQTLIKACNKEYTITLYEYLVEYIQLKKKFKTVVQVKTIARELGMNKQSVSRTLAWKHANEKTKELVEQNKISMPLVLRVLQKCHGKKQEYYIEKIINQNLNYDTVDLMLSNDKEINTTDPEIISRQYYRVCNRRIETLHKELFAFNNITDEYKEKLKAKLIMLDKSIQIILKN